MNFNVISGKDYEGRNQVELEIARTKNGFNSSGWVTFLQAKELKRKVKKGSHGISVFKGYEKFDDVRKDKNGNEKFESISRPLGFARVFNLDQTEEIK
jgi:antirestriction protein ArdC